MVTARSGWPVQHIAASEIQSVCLLAIAFDLSDQAARQSLAGANLMEHALSQDTCSHILHQLHEAQILSNVYTAEQQLWEAIRDVGALNQAQRQFQPAWLATSDAFDQAAVAAVAARPAGVGRRGAPAVAAVPAIPAQPGPQQLKCLHLTSWLAILMEGQRQLPGQESRLISRTIALLSHRFRNAARQEANSEIRSICSTLSTYVSTWAGMGAAATPSQVARQIPPYLARCMSVMPTDLVGPCGTADACEAELRDGQTLLCGRESEAASVLWSRIHHNLDRFPVLDQFKGQLHNSGATKEMLERLMIGMTIPSGSPLVRTWELARDLERRGKAQAVRDLFAAGSTVSAVVDEILDSHVTTAGASTVPDSGGGGSEGDRGGHSLVGSMEQKEFE